MIGLEEVKAEIHKLHCIAVNNYQRELESLEIDDVMLHRLFVGNPGKAPPSILTLADGNSILQVPVRQL